MDTHKRILIPGADLRKKKLGFVTERKRFNILQAYRFVLAHRQANREKKIDRAIKQITGAGGPKKKDHPPNDRPSRTVTGEGLFQKKRLKKETKEAIEKGEYLRSCWGNIVRTEQQNVVSRHLGHIVRTERREKLRQEGGYQADRGIGKNGKTTRDLLFDGKVYPDCPTQLTDYTRGKYPTVRVSYYTIRAPQADVEKKRKRELDRKTVCFSAKDHESSGGAVEAAKKWVRDNLNEFGNYKPNL